MKTIRIIATTALMMALAAPALAATPTSTNATTSSPQQVKKTSIIYVTKRGKCFHKASCPKLNIRRTKGMKRYQAEEAGYRPCKRCIGKPATAQ